MHEKDYYTDFRKFFFQRGMNLSKSLALLFSCLGIFCLAGMSIAMAHSLKWVIIWGVLSLLIIGMGFMVKVKLRKLKSQTNQEE